MAYFWGPVRDHVNRVALEYTRRLHRRPVWISVPAGTHELGGVDPASMSNGLRVFSLGRSDDIARSSGTAARLPPGGPETSHDLVEEVGRYIDFPEAARRALEALTERSGPTTLLITNLDRLGHVNLLSDVGLSNALLQTMASRGVTVVVTSQGLIHAPALRLECAFRVESTPEEYWTQAEIWPGVPVSHCSTCPGSPTGNYATCSEEFRSACPVRLPFTVERGPFPPPAPLAVSR